MTQPWRRYGLMWHGGGHTATTGRGVWGVLWLAAAVALFKRQPLLQPLPQGVTSERRAIMVIDLKIKSHVNRAFSEIGGSLGEAVENPVTGTSWVKGVNAEAPQRECVSGTRRCKPLRRGRPVRRFPIANYARRARNSKDGRALTSCSLVCRISDEIKLRHGSSSVFW